MIHSIKIGNPKEYVLVKNGVQSVCPFTQPFPMPAGENQVNIMRIPCTTQCPHANFITTDSITGNWEITCSGKTERFVIEEENSQTFEMRSV
jgi:hypothetical protein